MSVVPNRYRSHCLPLFGAIWVLWAMAASLPTFGEDLSEVRGILAPIPEAWKEIESLSVKSVVHGKWENEYLKWRESIGYPIQIRHPESFANLTYFAKGEWFGCDHVMRWGNGKISSDFAGAWNGKTWRKLNRISSGSNVLEIASIRKGVHELNAHGGSPLTHAFRFLIMASREPASTEFRDDEYLLVPTLDKIKKTDNWMAAFRRARNGYRIEKDRDVPCIVVEFDNGFGAGDRSTKVYTTVWFPMENPEFPQKMEIRREGDRHLLGRFAVEEFQSVDGIEIRFPRRTKYEIFANNDGYPNSVYQTTEYEFHSLEVNTLLGEEAFRISSSDAREILDLDSGQRIKLKR